MYRRSTEFIRISGQLMGIFRETNRRIVNNVLLIKGFCSISNVLALFHEAVSAGMGGEVRCFRELAGLSLRVIEVNTFEPLLKTLTPRQTLYWKGFAGSQVKLYRRGGEPMQDPGVMGFGDLGELVRER